MKQKISLTAVSLLLVAVLLAGCSAKGSMGGESMPQDAAGEMSGSAPEMPQEENVIDSAQPEASGVSVQQAPGERKIIQNADVSLETLEYEKTLESIEKLVSDRGGYIESSSTQGSGVSGSGYGWRQASFTVRVPADGLSDFAGALDGCGSVTSSSFYTNEVSDYYYDSEAHLKSLQLQEERLLDILSKATQLEEIITLETSLADVRYQIESLQGTLRRLDSEIAMSTVNIYVQEVSEYSPDQGRPRSLGQRIAAEFSASMQAFRRAGENFLVFFLGNIVGIVLWAAVLACVVVFVRRRLKKRLPDRSKTPEDSSEHKPKE